MAQERLEQAISQDYEGLERTPPDSRNVITSEVLYQLSYVGGARSV